MPTPPTARAAIPATPVQPAQPASSRSAAGFWIHRYLAQDLVSKLAAAAWAWTVLPADTGAGVGASSCALVEIAAFYAVVWLRARRAEPWRARAHGSLFAAIVREYGPAELVDLAVRPAAMSLAFAAGSDAIVAVLLGSLAADLAFYGTAMLACRRSERIRKRTEAVPLCPVDG